MVGLKRSRASALVAVLLMTSLLLVTGMAMLSSKSSEYEEAARLNRSAQARMLAESGLIDFETKLNAGLGFPPPMLEGSFYFSYTENLMRSDGSIIGSYTVKLDRSLEASHRLWRVTSLGLLGESGQPLARHTAYGEIDVSPTLREDSEKTNPNYLNWVNIELSIPGAGGG